MKGCTTTLLAVLPLGLDGSSSRLDTPPQLVEQRQCLFERDTSIGNGDSVFQSALISFRSYMHCTLTLEDPRQAQTACPR
jgi:hypothetical protein